MPYDRLTTEVDRLKAALLEAQGRASSLQAALEQAQATIEGYKAAKDAQQAHIDSLQAALDKHGANLTADDIFADWVVANWVQDPDALAETDRYGYRDLTLPFTPEIVHDSYPVTGAPGSSTM